MYTLELLATSLSSQILFDRNWCQLLPGVADHALQSALHAEEVSCKLQHHFVLRLIVQPQLVQLHFAVDQEVVTHIQLELSSRLKIANPPLGSLPHVHPPHILALAETINPRSPVSPFGGAEKVSAATRTRSLCVEPKSSSLRKFADLVHFLKPVS